MKKSNLIIAFVLLVIVLVVGFFIIEARSVDLSQEQNLAGSYFAINNKKIDIELALTSEAREKGLSGREALADNAGMLFVFPFPYDWGFWMKDMNFPLDIIWLDENKVVTHIEEHVAPETYPKSFLSNSQAKYVLEIPAGKTQEYGMKKGDIAEIVISP